MISTLLSVAIIACIFLNVNAFLQRSAIPVNHYGSSTLLKPISTRIAPSKSLHAVAPVVANSAAQVAQTIRKASFKSIATLLSTCGLGCLAASKGLLDQNTMGVLSKCVFNIFQPCLLFVNVGAVVGKIAASGDLNAAIFLLPLFAFFQIAFGRLIAKIFAKVLFGKDKSSERAKELVATTTFSNSGPLPLVFSAGLFAGHANPALLPKAIAYISLYLLGWSPLFWIIGPSILSDDTQSSSETPEEKRKKLFTRIVSPPVVGSVFGMIVGFTAPLRNLVGPTGPLAPVIEAMRTLGAGYLPAVLLVLAGSLASSFNKVSPENDSHSSSIVEKAKANSGYAKQLIATYLAKFLLFPTLMMSIISFSMNNNVPFLGQWLINDPMLQFVLLLESCMPSAQNLTVILQLQGKKDAAGRLARTLMFLYILGVPAITFWLVRILEFTKLIA